MPNRAGNHVEGVFHMSQSTITPEEFARLLESEVLPETRLFDDVYFIGNTFVGVTLLKTSEGIIMIDAMCREEDWDNIILPKMRESGLAPEDIKILIISHGHVDHYGAAKKIKQVCGCKVYLSEIDDAFMREHLLPLEGVPTLRQGKDAVPEVDGYLDEGDVVRLGETEVEVFFTPGHTPGGLSFVFPVHDEGKKYLAGLWGGTKIPKTREAAEQYLDSITRFRQACKERGVSVSIQNHPFVDFSLQKGMYHGKIAQAKAEGRSNPMVMGEERFQTFLNCIHAAAIGKLERM